jgi:hypothetical protein
MQLRKVGKAQSAVPTNDCKWWARCTLPTLPPPDESYFFEAA